MLIRINSLKRMLIVSAVMIAGGCTTIDFKQPISTYNEGMAKSSGAVADYYSGLNDTLRENYFNKVKYNNNNKLEEYAGGVKTPVFAIIPPEAIKVRVEAINLISQFGSQLAVLAGSDAPKRSNDAIVSIGSTYSTLANRFSSSPDIANNRRSAAYAPFISTIAGAVAESYVESKRREFLDNAINQGCPAVEKVLGLLQEDLPKVQEWIVGKADNQVTDAMAYYNEHRISMSFQERSVMLSEIKYFARSYQELVVNQPSQLIVAMRKVNVALRDFASSTDDSRVVKLTAAIEEFNNIVSPIASSIKEMRAIK